jgi:hypothetical protein
MGTIPRPKGFPIEGKKHMKELKNKFDMGFNEINHKIDMKVKKDYRKCNPFWTSATQSETYSPAGNTACRNPNMDCNKGLMMT